MNQSTEKMYKDMAFNRLEKFGDKYGKKLMRTATKTGIDASKTASKRVVQNTTEAIGDLIGYKITDKITSLSRFFMLVDLLFIFFNSKVTNLLLPKSRRKGLSRLSQVR